MDTESLVESAMVAGVKLIEKLFQEGFEVLAAVWLKTSEKGRWRFYVVSSVVETAGIHQAYGRLHTLIREMPQPFGIDPLEVKLLGPSDPIARDVLAIHSQASAPKGCPVRWEGNALGNVSIEGAYLYPLPAAPVS